MKVIYRESGGFAGLIRETEIDTSLLALDEAKELTQLVAQSNISGGSRMIAHEYRDLPQYEITIDNESGTNHFSFDSRSVTEQIKPLLKYLKQRAKPGLLHYTAQSG